MKKLNLYILVLVISFVAILAIGGNRKISAKDLSKSADKTFYFNNSFLNYALENKEELKEENGDENYKEIIGILPSMFFEASICKPFEPINQKISIFVTNTKDINNLLKENKINNKYNVDYSHTNYKLPLDDPKYEKLFNDIINNKERDIPDTIILKCLNDDILNYVYIDGRLIDCSKIMNKKIFEKDYKKSFCETDQEMEKEFTITKEGKNYYLNFGK